MIEHIVLVIANEPLPSSMAVEIVQQRKWKMCDGIREHKFNWSKLWAARWAT